MRHPEFEPWVGALQPVAFATTLWTPSRKANNLCFQCGEPYNPTHATVCTKKPKAQANALVVNDLNMPLSEEILT